MGELLHLTERASWQQAQHDGAYRLSTRGQTLEQAGFIHCSLRHQLRAVAEFVYGGASDDEAAELVILVIDSDLISVPVIYEAPAAGAEEYPHIYGPLPVAAVSDVIAVGRDSAGRFILPQ